MNQRRAPRYQGKITSWKDEQGFGFIAPNGGGPAVFVHVSSFVQRGIRPELQDVVTYDLAANDKGQPRAEKVAFVLGRPARPAAPPTAGPAPLIALGFFVFLGACVLAGKLPAAVPGAYAAFSLAAYLAYSHDKEAARARAYRTRERTLHLLALIGGWPGAMLAQQKFRHKTVKPAFRIVYRATVLANCAALAWMLTPAGSALLHAALG